MKILKGKYQSLSENRRLDAVGIELSSGSFIGIADFSGTAYTFYSRSELIDVELEQSKIFPKVTDYFGQELLEMTIKFKG